MSEAPAGNCRGFGDKKYKARWVLPRGSAAGISVYIKVNLSALQSA